MDGHRMIGMQFCLYDANWRFDAMLTDADFSLVGEGDDETDHSMPAHAEITNVIKENHASDAIRLARHRNVEPQGLPGLLRRP